MIKPRPLKGKIQDWVKDESYDGKAPVIRISDNIRAAVEWLKESIFNHDWEPEKINKSEVISLVDEAFEDVMRK